MKRKPHLSHWLILLFLSLFLSACNNSTVTSVATPLSTPTPSNDVLPKSSTITSTTATATISKPLVSSTQNNTVSASLNQNFRRTNWNEALRTDPAFSVEIYSSNDLNLELKADKSVHGLPQLNSLIYLDMDADAIEEVLIPLAQPPSGINAFVIYRYATAKPHLVTWGNGFELAFKVEKDKLVIRKGIPSDLLTSQAPKGTQFASAFQYATYTLQNDKLKLEDLSFEPNPAVQPLFVEFYYRQASEKRFSQAYLLLSPDFRRYNPFQSWLAGFSNTAKIEVKTTAEPTTLNTVRVELTVTDSLNGATITKRFSGTWRVTWSDESKSWLLSVPNIKLLSDTA